jgi:hypothetical protein
VKRRYSDPRPLAVLDTECYRNYWSIGFRNVENGNVRILEKWNDEELDRPMIARILRKFRVVSFNGINYDMPMIALAMSGADNETLKRASDAIILSDLKPWQFEELYGVRIPDFIDHIDLIEVAPGQGSLKAYAGRLHTKRMQDLPIDPDEHIDQAKRDTLYSYLGNDLQGTVDLLTELQPQIALRESMSDEYNIDLRSKSDAQIAEAVIKHEIEKITGRRIYKPEVRPGTFLYKPPKFIQFETEVMQRTLRDVMRSSFVVRRDGRVDMPPALAQAAIHLGTGVYRMGIGGLHSSEVSVSQYSDDEYVLLDRDVTSYYPWIILILKLFPPHLGEVFLKVYKAIVDRRISAKAAGLKSIAETLKIVINGSFGKFGSPYSLLYAINLMIQVTVTGQLSLLMLIERLVLRGFEVISANTDGLVTKVPRARRAEFEAIVIDWEMDTGFNTEETEYRSVHSRDVNNYIAITAEGKVKLKGVFAESGPGQPGAAGLKKNPSTEICTDAVVAFLKDGVPIETTIHECTDIRQFVTIRKVNGGALFNGKYLGKVVRWYYSTNKRGIIEYATNGNSVPRSNGAMPCMQLPDEFPADVDHEWYIREAYAILDDIAADFEEIGDGRTGTALARLPDAKNIHLVDLSTGTALCGAKPASRREPWMEYPSPPAGHRMCAKCRRETGL